jgi:predicted nucleic acid-binding protein
MAVIDASALVELLLNTRRAADIGKRAFAGDELLQAPSLIDLEVMQVLRRHVRGGALSLSRAQEALHDLIMFPLERYGHELLLPRIWQLRDSMSAYDASYVALAETLDEPLLTCDDRLARTGGHAAKVVSFA